MLRQSLSRHTVPASASFRGMFEPRSARREREQRPGASAAHAERRQAREPKVVPQTGLEPVTPSLRMTNDIKDLQLFMQLIS